MSPFPDTNVNFAGVRSSIMAGMWADPPEEPPGPGNSWLPLLGAVALAIAMLWLAGGATAALVALGAALVVAFAVSVVRCRRRARPGIGG